MGGDLIVAIDKAHDGDRQPVREFEDLVVFLARHTSVGDSVTTPVLREGKVWQARLPWRPGLLWRRPVSQPTSPSRMARATASVRVLVPSLDRISLT